MFTLKIFYSLKHRPVVVFIKVLAIVNQHLLVVHTVPFSDPQRHYSNHCKVTYKSQRTPCKFLQTLSPMTRKYVKRIDPK